MKLQKIFFSILMLISAFDVQASTLSSIAPEFKDKRNWTKVNLQSIFEQATPDVMLEDIEYYKVIDGNNRDGSTAYPISTLEKINDFQTNRCLVFARDPKKNDSAWKFSQSYLFKYPMTSVKKYYSDSPDALEEMSLDSAGDVLVHSGETVPCGTCNKSVLNIYNLPTSLRVKEESGIGLIIGILPSYRYNYFDVQGPAVLTFKKYKGNLIGQFKNPHGEVAGYKLCYNEPAYYCYADDTAIKDPTKRALEIEIKKAKTLKQAQSDLTNAIKEWFSWNRQDYPTGEYKADFQKVVRSMRCDSDLTKLPILIQRSTSNDDKNESYTIERPMLYPEEK